MEHGNVCTYDIITAMNEAMKPRESTLPNIKYFPLDKQHQGVYHQ